MTDSRSRVSPRWDPIALFFLVGQFVICAVWFVPEWSFRHLVEPGYVGMTGSGATVALVLVARALRAPRLERFALAMFLILMPGIYLAGWGVTQHGPGAWLEILGLVIFATLTVLGLMISPWYLALGIIAHGAFWDLWHHERIMTQHYMPSWYPVACFIADVGVGVYACRTIRDWSRE